MIASTPECCILQCSQDAAKLNSLHEDALLSLAHTRFNDIYTGDEWANPTFGTSFSCFLSQGSSVGTRGSDAGGG